MRVKDCGQVVNPATSGLQDGEPYRVEKETQTWESLFRVLAKQPARIAEGHEGGTCAFGLQADGPSLALAGSSRKQNVSAAFEARHQTHSQSCPKNRQAFGGALRARGETRGGERQRLPGELCGALETFFEYVVGFRGTALVAAGHKRIPCQNRFEKLTVEIWGRTKRIFLSFFQVRGRLCFSPICVE